MLAARVALPDKDYAGHLQIMPFRTSVFTTTDPRLLPPLVRRLNLDAEGGLKAVSYTHLDVYKRQGLLLMMKRLLVAVYSRMNRSLLMMQLMNQSACTQ